ncbi:hypothetical protein HKX48_006687 [Thoreauomyces humboldtii]|nr:hypothetical protein HKX48_006687 [Thoreauomyces humboldtii]
MPAERVHILYETRSNNVAHLLKESFLEWVAVIVVLCASGGLEFVNPYERVAFGYDQDISYPMRTQTVPTWLLAVIAFAVPIVVIFGVSLGVKRSVFDLHQALLGLCVALSFTLLITQIVKVAVGGLRPDFLARCQPIYDDSLLKQVVSCQGSAGDIKEGRKSFFSGHSSLSWAGLGFLSLYLSRHLNFYKKPLAPKYALTIIPVIAALLVSISRVDNYWHRWQDVVVGAAVGITMAIYCYRYHCAPLEDEGILKRSYTARLTDFLATGRSRRSFDDNEPARFPGDKRRPGASTDEVTVDMDNERQ